MKIAVPVLVKEPIEESVLFGHFGRAEHYALLDIDNKTFEIIENASDHFGGIMSPPDFLANHGVEMVLVEAMGEKAFQRFNELGIKVVKPKKELSTIKELLENPYEWIEIQAAEELKSHEHGKHHHDNHHDCEK